MLDFSAALLDPVYGSDIGRPATLTINADTTYAQAFPVTVIDKTAGAPTGGRVTIETIRPCARIRQTEVTGLGLAVTDLKRAELTIGPVVWKIKAYEVLPLPSGPGEIELILIDEDE